MTSPTSPATLSGPRPTLALLTAALAGIVTASASAQDLTVASVQVNQAIQLGGTQLVGGNTTIVRMSVGTGGGTFANVDAVLRMSVGNVPVGGPPVFSMNGPITAVVAPNLANVNDTLNFMVIPPVSTDVDFTIEVNPNRNVAESNYGNNTLAVNNLAFNCRRVVELPYVPINYTFNGAGLPPANLMEPGIGDGFVRGIYSTEWSFHKSPLPALTWAQDINGSTSAMHTTLNDIRLNQLPAAGYPQAGIIYAWLPGNPYSGNGQAGGIPGNTAFGNTDPSRHQRTCAHELGHCFGLSHVSMASGTINTNGFDEEHHLKDTQNLPLVFPATKYDIMVAGLLTNQAWVRLQSYNTVLNDARLACVADDGEGVPPVPVMRIAGVITHDTRAVELYPVMRISRGHLTPDNPNGDIRVEAVNAAGQTIWSAGFRTDTARERCEPDANGRPVLEATGPFHLLFPETVGGEAIQEVRVIDVATGNLLAKRVRSPGAPENAITAIERLERGVIDNNNDRPAAAAGDAAAGRISGRVRVQWTAHDGDGDGLTHNLLYTPDAGASWYPVVVNSTESSFEFDSTDLPASDGDNGGFMLVTSDGLNNTTSSTGAGDEGGIAFGPGTPPETFLLTPNTGGTFPQHAAVPFHGTSWDKENQLLGGGSMVWTSNLDGQIGTGRLFTKATLTPGTHTITLTGTDSANMSTSKQVVITITPRVVISPDCNENFVLDLVDILSGTSLDINGNGIPDECETQPCVGDINGSGAVDVDDLVAVILGWGPCPAPPTACPADVNGTGTVNVDDLVAVILNWGVCP